MTVADPGLDWSGFLLAFFDATSNWWPELLAVSVALYGLDLLLRQSRDHIG